MSSSTSSTSSKKLKFKAHKNKKNRRRSLDDEELATHSKKRRRHRHDQQEDYRDRPKYYEPPVIFEDEDGCQPNAARLKPDLDWQQHLFDTMAEDEGLDYHFSMF